LNYFLANKSNPTHKFSVHMCIFMYVVEFKFSICQRAIKKEKVYGESN